MFHTQGRRGSGLDQGPSPRRRPNDGVLKFSPLPFYPFVHIQIRWVDCRSRRCQGLWPQILRVVEDAETQISLFVFSRLQTLNCQAALTCQYDSRGHAARVQSMPTFQAGEDLYAQLQSMNAALEIWMLVEPDR